MPLNIDLNNFLNNVFFEAGTGDGNGVQAALDAGFQKIISCDIHHQKVLSAKRRFKKEIAEDRVEIYKGRAHEVMAAVIPYIEDSITFWLHAMGPRRQRSSICDQLNVIAAERTAAALDTVIIDDFRILEEMGRGPLIYKTMTALNPDYIIEDHDEADIVSYVPKGDLKLPPTPADEYWGHATPSNVIYEEEASLGDGGQPGTL